MVVTRKGDQKLDKKLIGDNIIFSLPLEKRYASILRLAVAGIASKMDFNWEQIEEIKMAVEEVFLLSLKAGNQSEIIFNFNIKEEGLEIDLDETYLSSELREKEEERYSFFILTGLMDDVLVQPKGELFHLKMLKKYW